jgi:Tfp pilus assembly protein PilX
MNVLRTPQISRSSARRTHQRGAAALAVALLLLFGMTVIAFFANRGMIFEQRTSANQYRSTKAFELAEAGMEWAVARMNDEAFATAAPSCASTTATTTTLAERYLARNAAGFVWAGGRKLMACRIDGPGAVNCTCPVAGNAPSFASGFDTEGRFLVEFLQGADPTLLRVVSRGCTNASSSCELGSSPSGDFAGHAVVTALFKIKPALPGAPGAGLVTGAAASVTGNLTVINKDPKSNGITVNSGSIVDLSGSTSVVTLDGTPPRASVLDNDPALRDLANADANGELFFRSFFNQGFTDFKNSLKTWVVTAGSCAAYAGHCTQCTGNAASCGQIVADVWKNNNVERFWTDMDVTFAANNYATGETSHGTDARPLNVASSANIGFNGNVVAYGLFYAATASADANYVTPGTGNATVYGAIVSRSTFDKGSGHLNLIYQGSLFDPLKQPLLLVRVPGSWRDTYPNEL